MKSHHPAGAANGRDAATVRPGPVSARVATSAAYRTLRTHRADPISGFCRMCQCPGPCTAANEAANALVALGLVLTERRLGVRSLGGRAQGAVVTVFARVAAGLRGRLRLVLVRPQRLARSPNLIRPPHPHLAHSPKAR